jgi:hypothetical protein
MRCYVGIGLHAMSTVAVVMDEADLVLSVERLSNNLLILSLILQSNQSTAPRKVGIGWLMGYCESKYFQSAPCVWLGS